MILWDFIIIPSIVRALAIGEQSLSTFKSVNIDDMSMLKAVFFDLDGTLLPMVQKEFVKHYFSAMAKVFAPLGYDPEKFQRTIWGGIDAESKNDGSRTNLEVFWDYFASVFGEKSRKDAKVFDDYYKTEFQKVKDVCGYSPLSKEIVSMLKQRGCKVVLATNPIFPEVATISRIKWAGLDPKDFDAITYMENSGLTKPNPEYFKHLLNKIDVPPENCIMVGNDVDEDMVASELGMKVFLVKGDIISRTGKDISAYPTGDLSDLKQFLENELCQ